MLQTSSDLLGSIKRNPFVTFCSKTLRSHNASSKVDCFLFSQVEESLNDMDFQLFLDLYFTDGDYT